MSSVFVSDNSGVQQQQKSNEPSRPKRPRSSLACIRCRKKKVKCDFVQPTCGRCAMAGLPCSYATPPRRVDGHAFDQLGNHVEELKERMQKMQSELAMMKNNLHPLSGTSSGSSDDGMLLGGSVGNSNHHGQQLGMVPSTSGYSSMGGGMDNGFGGGELFGRNSGNNNNNMALMDPSLTNSISLQQPVTWKLSLSPSGLRIDTNIASVADLYRILLNGISQLNINGDSATSLFSTDSIRTNSSIDKKHQHDYSASPSSTHSSARHSQHQQQQQQHGLGTGMMMVDDGGGDSGNGGSGRVWEVDDKEARKILQEQYQQQTDDTMAPELLDQLVHSCYHRCFLAYQIVDKESFMKQYVTEPGLDPLLGNSINAWMSKHGCIYHNATPGLSPAKMGESYFKNARQLLKKCFDISSPVTIHALLNLYMYQLSSERSSLAYLYIGLAIRMAQDLKYHKKEHMPSDPQERETNKRLWWSAYWLDLCAALESNRPTMVDDKDCDLEYPVKLDSEDDETGYRIDFCVHSIKLMKIRKDITKHLPSEQSGQSLLSAISRLENSLTNWLNELPTYLRMDYDDTFQKSGSFRDETTLILNIQYQTTWIMLHKFFLPKKDQTATPVALLSLNICTKSANFITKMLDLYATHLSWCQFFYALDGVIASVAIHQVNAVSTEKELAYLAQRNLIMTANVLRGSPLTYMDKVNDVMDSIDAFLKQNGLPTHINDIPPINEDSANQQSISSVFHPTLFDQQQQSQQQQQQQQQATPPPPTSTGTPAATSTTANMNSMHHGIGKAQTSLTSTSTISTPQINPGQTGLTTSNSASSFGVASPQQQQQHHHSQLAPHATVPSQISPQHIFTHDAMSPIPTTHSPQPKMVPSLPKENTTQRMPTSVYASSLQQQQQQPTMPTSMMDPSTMMFNDTMMGLGQGMDPSFFEDMTGAFGSGPHSDNASFAMSNQQQPHSQSPHHHQHQQMHHHHHHQQQQQQQQHNQQQQQPDITSMFTTNPMLANTFGNNDGSFGMDQGLYGASYHPPSFMNQPSQQPSMFNTIPPSTSSPVATTTTTTTTTTTPLTAKQPPSTIHTSASSLPTATIGTSNANIQMSMYGSQPSNTGAPPMDGLLNMDPDTMNAFLQYNPASFSTPFGYQQQQQQQQQQQMMTPEMMFGAANRKRQRDWDQQGN